MKLQEIIIEKIKKEGFIPFDEFMEMALYYPEAGYYTRAEIKIGREGDFFTASHLGSAFGLLLGRQIEILWKRLGCPDDFTVTEIGPGMGYLAKDILDSLDLKIPLKYNLVEINPFLTQIQKERLKSHKNKTFWYHSIEDLLPFKGLIICNEVFDALPVRLFEIRQTPLEIYVTLGEKEMFKEKFFPCRQDTLQYLLEFAPWVLKIQGFRSEVNLSMRAFIKKLNRILKKGYVIVFDYGYTAEEYYHPSRNKGTLLCYYKHTINENPYLNIGKQDITAHVNFTALQKWATQEGFSIEEFSSQGRYLVSLCDEKLLHKIHQKDLIQQFKRLVLPQGMGQSHKVLILSKH